MLLKLLLIGQQKEVISSEKDLIAWFKEKGITVKCG